VSPGYVRWSMVRRILPVERSTLPTDRMWAATVPLGRGQAVATQWRHERYSRDAAVDMSPNSPNILSADLDVESDT
jgi:hypothetical protein